MTSQPIDKYDEGGEKHRQSTSRRISFPAVLWTAVTVRVRRLWHRLIQGASRPHHIHRKQAEKPVWQMSDEEYNLRRRHDSERVDALLDKISAHGYNSLSAEEKSFLSHYKA